MVGTKLADRKRIPLVDKGSKEPGLGSKCLVMDRSQTARRIGSVMF